MSLIRLVIHIATLTCLASVPQVFGAPAGAGDTRTASEHAVQKRAGKAERAAIRQEIRVIEKQIRTSRDPALRQALMKKRASLRTLSRPSGSDRAMHKGGN